MKIVLDRRNDVAHHRHVAVHLYEAAALRMCELLRMLGLSEDEIETKAPAT